MSIIKQSLFKIELSKPKTQWQEVFFVEADSFEEALIIAKEVKEAKENHYEEWNISSINKFAPLFKSTTKTITVEL